MESQHLLTINRLLAKIEVLEEQLRETQAPQTPPVSQRPRVVPPAPRKPALQSRITLRTLRLAPLHDDDDEPRSPPTPHTPRAAPRKRAPEPHTPPVMHTIRVVPPAPRKPARHNDEDEDGGSPDLNGQDPVTPMRPIRRAVPSAPFKMRKCHARAPHSDDSGEEDF